MFSNIRKRLTYANVAMTLALVFAMSGGAYAASKYVITSTKQISPKVLKALKGKAGPAGKNGTNGTNGAPGATGPAGPTGATGATGTGTPGATGAEGKEGKPGESVTNTAAKTCGPEGGAEFKVGTGAATKACNGKTGFTETLPSGKTETGVWGFSGHSTGLAVAAMSFSIPLGSALAGSAVIPPGEEGKVEPVNCPGTLEEPKAASGFLCVYSQPPDSTEVAKAGSYTLSSVNPKKSGGVVYFNVALLPTEEPYINIGTVAGGTWAVTAG
jgi:hypothetical protein